MKKDEIQHGYTYGSGDNSKFRYVVTIDPESDRVYYYNVTGQMLDDKSVMTKDIAAGIQDCWLKTFAKWAKFYANFSVYVKIH